MDDKLKFAAVLLGGYVLGRTKRMKLALAVAGAMAVRELRSNPDLLKTGSSVLSSPAVKKLTDELSGRLVEAGKTAAVAAAAKRVDGLVSNLEKRASERQAGHGPEEDEPADAPEESPEPTEESADEETEEPSDEEETAQEDEPAQEDEEAPAAKRSSRGSSTSGGARSSRSSAQSGSRQSGSKQSSSKQGTSKQSSSGTRARKSSGTSSARRSGSR